MYLLPDVKVCVWRLLWKEKKYQKRNFKMKLDVWHEWITVDVTQIVGNGSSHFYWTRVTSRLILGAHFEKSTQLSDPLLVPLTMVKMILTTECLWAHGWTVNKSKKWGSFGQRGPYVWRYCRLDLKSSFDSCVFTSHPQSVVLDVVLPLDYHRTLLDGLHDICFWNPPFRQGVV